MTLKGYVNSGCKRGTGEGVTEMKRFIYWLLEFLVTFILIVLCFLFYLKARSL